MARDRVAVVARVAHQGPAGAVRVAHVVGQVDAAAHRRDHTTGTDPPGQRRGDVVEGRDQGVGTPRPRGADRLEQRGGPGEPHAGRPVVGRERPREGSRRHVELEAAPRNPVDVGVEGRHLAAEGRPGPGADPPGRARAQAVGADDEGSTQRADLAVAGADPDPADPPGSVADQAGDAGPGPHVAPRSAAAVASSASSAVRRGATSRSTPARSFTGSVRSSPPTAKVTSRIAGAPVASTRSSRPQRASWTTPPRAIAWVDRVSLGSCARSSTAASCPRAASSRAVAEPATRAPTTTTSCTLVREAVMGYLALALHRLARRSKILLTEPAHGLEETWSERGDTRSRCRAPSGPRARSQARWPPRRRGRMTLRAQASPSATSSRTSSASSSRSSGITSGGRKRSTLP